MPHCLLEASNNLPDQPDWVEVLSSVNHTLVATGLFVEADIKSRLLRHDTFVVGDGDPRRAFVTLNVQILGGRTDEVKAQLTEALLPALARHFPLAFAERIFSLTVQITDIHRPSYRRQLN